MRLTVSTQGTRFGGRKATDASLTVTDPLPATPRCANRDASILAGHGTPMVPIAALSAEWWCPVADSDWLDAIEARLRAATPGPWQLGWEEDSSWVAFVSEHGDQQDDYWRTITANAASDGRDRADAEFIAHAPEDIAALVAAVRERDAALARVEALAESLVWKRPKVSPCAEYGFACCGSEAMCDAMSPSVSVVGHREIRAALADPKETE